VRHPQQTTIILPLLIAILAGGCASLGLARQGNDFNYDAAAQLTKGMSMEQVTTLLEGADGAAELRHPAQHLDAPVTGDSRTAPRAEQVVAIDDVGHPSPPKPTRASPLSDRASESAPSSLATGRKGCQRTFTIMVIC